MKKKDKNSNSRVLLIVGVALILLILIGGVIYSQVYTKRPEVMVVSFGDGENQVEVNRNGEVTIRTPFGVYKQKWDKKKIEEFFAKFKNLDFESLTEFVGQGLAIELTFGNGVTIRVEYEEEMSGLVDELQKELEAVYQGDDKEINFDNKISDDYYYDSNQETNVINNGNIDGNDGQDSSQGGSSNNSGSSNDPWAGSGTQNLPSLECKEIDAKTGKSVIISNTVCGR